MGSPIAGSVNDMDIVDIVADVPAKFVGTVGIPFVFKFNEVDATEVPPIFEFCKDIVYDLLDVSPVIV